MMQLLLFLAILPLAIIHCVEASFVPSDWPTGVTTKSPEFEVRPLHCLQPTFGHGCSGLPTQRTFYSFNKARQVCELRRGSYQCPTFFNRFATADSCEETCRNSTKVMTRQKLRLMFLPDSEEKCIGMPFIAYRRNLVAACQGCRKHAYKFDPHTNNCYSLSAPSHSLVYNTFNSYSECVRSCSVAQPSK